ncbi:DUF1127 domain-containing protein [Pararhodobacter sp.]|uniref:DUF1127 domain-containing protein n=1 Tax=Pararhodobacter sp. TaxID=2127056 RepID=UPI002AFF0574|nr:DUF1127 domain-containing protein [Pararhodobacter sp.]
MFVSDITQNPSRGFAATMRRWIQKIQDQRMYRLAYANTFEELSMLSDRDLADIGVSRSDISEIAAQAAEQAT